MLKSQDDRPIDIIFEKRKHMDGYKDKEGKHSVPTLYHMSAKSNLELWNDRIRDNIRQYRDKNHKLQLLVFSETGFYADQKEIDILVKEKGLKIKEE